MPRIQPHDHSSFNQGGLIRPPAGLTGGADPGTVPSGGTSGGPGVIHAVDVLVADTGGLLAAGNVEDALAELAAPATLDDLTDVTLTTPATADRLRFDGSVWRNSALVWKNVMVLDPTSGNYLPVTTGAGEAVYTEAP